MSTSTTAAPPGATPGAAARTTGPVTQDDVVTRSSSQHDSGRKRIGTSVVFLWPCTGGRGGLGYG
ncbi:MAG: hypothetical protein ACTMIC_14145, partial [Cellulosimicrobium funkei]